MYCICIMLQFVTKLNFLHFSLYAMALGIDTSSGEPQQLKGLYDFRRF